MEKTCLIIDNEDQTEIIERIIARGRKKGIYIECFQFNVGSTFETDLLTDGKIDINKVVHEYRNRFRNITFHLAAIDWELSDENCNGVELIRQFTARKILRFTPKLLFSGLLEEKLSSMLDQFKNRKLNKIPLLNHIRTLIKIDIKDFVDREKYDEDILKLLESNDETLDLIIQEELIKFPDLKFSNSFTNKSFYNKTFEELSEILDSNDNLRNDFKKEIIQQVLAYLTIPF